MPLKPANISGSATSGPPAAGPSDAAVAAVARALAHPARIRIVRLLLERESCICGDIVDEVGLAQSTVSEHLRILKEAGVVMGEIERPRTCYFLNPCSMAALAGLLSIVTEKAARRASCGPACRPPGKTAQPAEAMSRRARKARQ